MAKYDIDYSCGHTGRVDLTGPYVQRNKRIDQLQSRVCPDCYKAQQQEAAQAAIAAVEGEGLPALTGSPKQIAWAEGIRANWYTLLRGWHEVQGLGELVDEALTLIPLRTEARWWIDHRYDTPEPGRMALHSLLILLRG